MSSLERGVRRRPYPSTLRSLAAALQLSPAEQAAFAAAARRTAVATPLAASRSGLPAPRTPLVGREVEVPVLCELVRGGASRLVTLTGAGGCGKTRLALAVAADVARAFPDGVWLVELAAFSDPSFVSSAVASVLGIRESAPGRLVEGLAAYLQQKRLLLVIDNCEHLVEACAAVVDRLLSACPDLHVLATSREPLRVAGEQVWPVAPLAVPDLEAPDLLLEAERSPSMRLFIDRASAAFPAFRLTVENVSTVGRICVRLDGIPLALELAAARTRVLSLEQILDRLDDVFGLLASSSRTAPARQQTLLAALDWSYDLLTEAERSVFRRLAVFAGGFDLEACEALMADDRLWSGDVLDSITRLVDKSLLVAELSTEPARYQLLEPLRDYGQRLLAASGELDEARRRHAAHYLELAEQAARELDGRRQVECCELLDLEQSNLRAVLGWSLEGSHIETGLRLAAALVPFWEIRGDFSEGRRWLSRVLAAAQANRISRSLHAKVLLGAARLANWQVDGDEAVRLCEESLALYKELGDRRGVAESLVWMSVAQRNRGELAQATTLVEATRDIYTELGDESGVAEALRNLSIIARNLGQTGRAVALGEESLTAFEALGDERHIARGRTQLGLAVLQKGDLSRARRLFIEGLYGHGRVGDRWFVGHALLGLAAVYSAEEEDERAVRLLGAVSVVHATLGTPLTPAGRDTFERLHREKLSVLGPVAFSAAWESGRDLSLEQVLSEARQMTRGTLVRAKDVAAAG